MWQAHLAVDQTFRLWRFDSVSIHGRYLRKPLLRLGVGRPTPVTRFAALPVQDPDTLVVGEPGIFSTACLQTASQLIGCLQQELEENEEGTSVTDTATEKPSIPGLKEFIEAHLAIDAHVQELFAKKNSVYHSTDNETYRAAYDEWREADRAKYDKRSELIAAFLEKNEDKLTEFVIENYLGDYSSQAITVLQALPATFEELSKLAVENDWCGVWEDAVEQAVGAGVIEMSEIEIARRKLRRRMLYDMGHYDADQAMKLVDELIELSVKQDRADRIENALNASESISE